MTVDVIIEDERWEPAGLEALAEKAVSAALSHLGLVPDAWEVAIMACDDARIAALNTEFRGYFLVHRTVQATVSGPISPILLPCKPGNQTCPSCS